ncbi:MAG TPA: hypothetical protein VJU61_25980 [Polyangiaceae bacterium]|nr:hypothetical protein [Polyangiaceae bacterium]
MFVGHMHSAADPLPSSLRPRAQRALGRGTAPAFASVLLAAALAWAALVWNTAATPSAAPRAASALPEAAGGPGTLPPLPALPPRLSGTGLYVTGSTTVVAPENLGFVPQYPLWSDGATKRRWIALPPGTRIDATHPDAWVFPIGTRFWKEFSFGERTETRYLERLPDGSYRYATYIWDAALGDAWLAPETGVRAAREIAPGVQHDIPSAADCRSCHEGRRSPVLGFNALQLSPDRDPLAPHREAVPPGSLDLPELVRRELLVNLPPALLERAPRIDAPSASARAAAGYLFGNCSSCHNAEGPLAVVGLDFDQTVGVPDGHAQLAAGVTRRSRFRIPGETASFRALPAHPQRSALWFRMHARDATSQMPPLGTKLVDSEGLRLIEQWISNDLNSPNQPSQ